MRHVMQAEAKGAKAPRWYSKLKCSRGAGAAAASDVAAPTKPPAEKAAADEEAAAFEYGYNFEVDKQYRRPGLFQAALLFAQRCKC